MQDDMRTNRIPPQDIPAEVCVLGSMILEPTARGRARAIVAAEDFYRLAHQMLFTAICAMDDARRPVDLVLLRDELNTRKQLEQIGGVAYLMELVEVPDASNVAHYAAIVRDKAAKRRMITLAHDATERLWADSEPAKDISQSIQQALFEQDRRAIGTEGTEGMLCEAVAEVTRRAEAMQLNPQTVRSVASGFPKLDAAIGGLRRGHFVTIAAAPGGGKSTLALNIANHVAAAGGRVLYVSAEMLPDELAQRSLQAAAGVWGNLIRDGRMRAQDWDQVNQAEAELRNQRLYIVGRAMNLAGIATKARELALRWQNRVDLIIVDYMQIMALPNGREIRDRLTAYTAGLKRLAMEMQTCVIGLSQFSREGVKPGYGGKQPLPSMYHLKESGSIECDSNAVILLHRPDPPVEGNDIDGRRFVEVWLRVAKCRDGTSTDWPCNDTSGITLRWYPGFTRFVEAI